MPTDGFGGKTLPRLHLASIGALLGGLLGTALGVAPAILICAIGATLAPLWAICSPLRRLRDQPIRDQE